MARGGSAHAQLRRGAGPRGEGGLAAPCPGHARHGGVAAQAHGDGKRSRRLGPGRASRARAVSGGGGPVAGNERTRKALAQKKIRIQANSNSVLNEFIFIEFLNAF